MKGKIMCALKSNVDKWDVYRDGDITLYGMDSGISNSIYVKKEPIIETIIEKVGGWIFKNEIKREEIVGYNYFLIYSKYTIKITKEEVEEL